MMEKSIKSRLFGIFVLLAVVALVTGVFYSAFHWPAGQSFRTGQEEPADPSAGNALSPVKNNILTLFSGRPVTLWKKKLVYHGMENGRVHIAVYILELDPEVAYHHRIPVKTAKRGFRLGGQKFTLESHGKHRIRLGIQGTYRKN